jgi:uncharacterized membrane protein YqjE
MILIYACILFIVLQVLVARHEALIEQFRFRTVIAGTLLLLVLAVLVVGKTVIAPAIITTLTVGCSVVLIKKFSYFGEQKEFKK